jgi:hypothetical protein
VAEQLAGPESGTAGKLQHVPGRAEYVKGFGQFIAAGKVQALVQIVRGQRPVVGDLLIEEIVAMRSLT